VSPGNRPGILVPSKVFFEIVFIMKRPVPQYDATKRLGRRHVYSLSFTAPPTICEPERCTERVRSLLLSGFGGRMQQVAKRCNWPGPACVHALSLSLSLSLSLPFSLSPFGESNIVSLVLHVTHLNLLSSLHNQRQTHLSL
jgi:hypothetical protein